MAHLFEASRDKNNLGHDAAVRIINRDHFKLLYQRNPLDIDKNPDAAAIELQITPNNTALIAVPDAVITQSAG